MVNIMRMDLYRLVHSKSLWVFLAIIVALAAISTSMVAYVSSPAFAESLKSVQGLHVGFSDAGSIAEASVALESLVQNLSAESLVGSSLLSGGALACLFAIFVAIFLTAEFEGGFAKNVLSAQPNRLALLAARSVEIAVLAVAFTAVSIGATLAIAAVAGLELAPTPPADLALWAALVALSVAAFGMLTALGAWATRKMLTALGAWATRKMAASIVIGVVLASGVVTAMLKGVLALFPSAPHIADYTPYSCTTSLAQGLGAAGALDPLHIALVTAAFIAIGIGLGAVALQKRDV